MDAPRDDGAAADALLAEAATAAQSVLVAPPDAPGSGGAGYAAEPSRSREPSPTLRVSSEGVLRAAFHFDDAPSPASLAAAGGHGVRAYGHGVATVVRAADAASPAPGARRALELTRGDSLEPYAPPTPDDEWLKRHDSAGSAVHAASESPREAAPASPPDTPPAAPHAHAPLAEPLPQPPRGDGAQTPPPLALPRHVGAAPALFPHGIPASYFMPAESATAASSHASFAAIAAAAAAAVAGFATSSPRHEAGAGPSAPSPAEPAPLQPARPPSLLPVLAAEAAARRMEAARAAAAAAAATAAAAAVGASPRFAPPLSHSQPSSPSAYHATVFDPQRRSRFDLLAAPRPKPPPPQPTAASGGWDPSPLPPPSPAARRAAASGAMEPPGGRNRARAALASSRPASAAVTPRRRPGPVSPSPSMHRGEDAAAAAAALLRGGRAFAPLVTASAPGSALPSPPPSPPRDDVGGPAPGAELSSHSGDSGRAVRRVASVGARMSSQQLHAAGASPPRSQLGGAAAPPKARAPAERRLSGGSTPRSGSRRWPSPPPPEARPPESVSQLADALGHSAAGDDWLAAVAAESAAAATRAGLLRLSDCDTSAFAEALRDATAAVHVLEGALATSALLPAAGSPGGAHAQQLQSAQPAAAVARRRSLASHAAAAALGAVLTAVVAAMAPQLGRALAAAWATVLRKAAAAAAA